MICLHSAAPWAPCADCTARIAQARQGAFVEKWRAEPPDLTYCEVWICPICRYAVQVAYDANYDRSIQTHQRFHGADWQAYEHAGATPSGGGE